MPRKKQYQRLERLEQSDPFQLQTDILRYLDEYGSASNERLIMMSLVRSFEALPKHSINAEIMALIRLLTERIQSEVSE